MSGLGGIIGGALAAGLSGAGEGMSEGIRNDMKEESRIHEIQALQEAETMKAKAIAQFTNDLTTASMNRAGAAVAQAAQQDIPVVAAPVTALSGNDPSQAYAGSAADGKGIVTGPTEFGGRSLPALLKAAQALPDSNPDKADFIAQLQRQQAADQQSAQDAVAGQTNKPTTSEAMKLAMQKLAASGEKGDIQAYAALKKLQQDKYMPVPYGGLLDTETGEIKGQQTYKTDNLQTVESGKNERASASNQTKIDVMNAKLAGTYKDPAAVTAQEKDLWLHQYMAGNGAVPRSAPPWVKNNIGTWAAEKGITPDDLQSGMAQAKYDASAAGTAGHRAGAMAGVEAVIPALASNAIELAGKLDQGKFVPINKLMQMTESNISDPDLSAFRVANQALVSEYQQVISRGGTGNVTALNEAMKVLSGATSTEAYASAVNQVMREVEMNTAGMKKVRSDMGGGKPEKASNPFASPAPTSTSPADGWSNLRVH